MMKNKKAAEWLVASVMYLVIVVAFFALMFIIVSRAGTGASIYEQVYAKKIALMIDSAKSGTEIKIDVPELFQQAEKNKFNEKIIEIDDENKKVIVRVAQGEGYSFSYFNDNIVKGTILGNEEKFKIEVL